MPLSSRPVSRRTTLAAAPLLALAGCRWGPAEDGDEPAAEPSNAVPDEQQVKAALQAIADADEYVREVSSDHVSLAEPLAALTALHTAHQALIAKDGDTGTTVRMGTPTRATAALKAVRRRELGLQRTLTRLAGEVSSGELARTLAAMAAGVAQQVALLPSTAKDADA
ncbi:hypothetical protein [Nocardioides sp. Root151]|uniref:hypothetical protein n=1 Tax=Nocardioides sp. Root151 TaxID=1736475 RepID=UPI000A525AAB|nr:hypothetical protein [Nocardioides sp. Root151]